MESTNNKLSRFALWLIRLRWVGVLGIALVTFIASRILKISVREFSLYMVSAGFLGLNIMHILLLRRINRRAVENITPVLKNLIKIQISSDFIALTLMLHYSGGIENPFILFYIFHMVMASIILEPRESFLQVTFALMVLALLIFSESSGILPHYGLTGFVSHQLYQSKIYLLATGIIFTSTSYLVVYITNSIMIQSRRHEAAYMKANA